MQRSIKGVVFQAIMLSSVLLSLETAEAALVAYSFTEGISTISLASLPSTTPLGSSAPGSIKFAHVSGSRGHNQSSAATGIPVVIGSYRPSNAYGANAVRISEYGKEGDGFKQDGWRLVSEAMGILPNVSASPKDDVQPDRDGGSILRLASLEHPPSLASLTAHRWRLVFANPDGDVLTIRGALNSFTTAPLSAAALLFGAGLISLVGLGAGGLRNLRVTQA
ncbi:MAG: hypothetical protein Q8L74_11215 [Nitrospirota bacterium]|nr:hypothetical protein [Nitrospirota bacterium]MDP2381386.1 hypothetical protein [Nitrospirota bacterium]MDP3595686.1 hypothetical protein [Nitrospirota bacterium]